jgi:hypothetical protein
MSTSLSTWSIVGSVSWRNTRVFIGVGGRQPAGAIYQTYRSDELRHADAPDTKSCSGLEH